MIHLQCLSVNISDCKDTKNIRFETLFLNDTSRPTMHKDITQQVTHNADEPILYFLLAKQYREITYTELLADGYAICYLWPLIGR